MGSLSRRAKRAEPDQPKRRVALQCTMDACPSDQLLGPPSTWHTIVVVCAGAIEGHKLLVEALEREMRRTIREWKGSTQEYRRAFASALVKILPTMDGTVTVSVISDRESTIARSEEQFRLALGLETKFCILVENGQEKGVSIGPFKLDGLGEFSHRFVRHRAQCLLWTAFNLKRLLQDCQAGCRIQQLHLENVDVLTDLQALDQPHDPWGVKCLAGILGTLSGGRVVLRTAHRRRGEQANMIHRAEMIADNLSGVLNAVLCETDAGNVDRAIFTKLMQPLFDRGDREEYFLWGSLKKDEPPGLPAVSSSATNAQVSP